MIRIDLLGRRRLGRRLARHPAISALLTFFLVLLVTIGFFRLLRTPRPAIPGAVTLPAQTVKVDAESDTDLEEGQGRLSPSQPQAGGAVPYARPEEGAEHAPSAPGAVAVADTCLRELPSVSLMARMTEILPPLVWFSSLRADSGGEYTIEGVAFSSQRAREFVGRLSSVSMLCAVRGPITAEADSYGRLAYHFTVCGATNGRGSEGVRRRAAISQREFAVLPDLFLSEGRRNGLSFPSSVVWEERPGLDKKGSLRASGRYDQVVAWLLALEKCGIGRYLTSFSVSPAPEPGPAENTLFSGTIDVAVQ